MIGNNVYILLMYVMCIAIETYRDSFSFEFRSILFVIMAF